MTGQDRGDDYVDEERAPSPTPWHYRTPAVLGASVLGLTVIGILILAVTYVARQFDEPPQAPLNFVEPSFSVTATGSSTPTTTATITSTSPPVTTDIDGPSATTSSSSDTSTTSSSSEPSTSTRVTQSRPSNDGSAPSTTRRGPRINVTRTLYPQP